MKLRSTNTLMKLKIELALFGVALCSTVAFGQQGSRITPADIYRSATGRERSPQEVEAMRRMFNEQIKSAQLERLRDRSATLAAPQSFESQLNREQRQLVRTLLQPGEAENSDYAQFFKLPNTGYAVFLAGNSCVRTISDERLSGFVGTCADNTLPGKGAYFSFRKNDYVSAWRADLGFKQDWFFSVGLLTQCIFADLGDVPISDIDLNSDKFKFLTSFVPAITFDAANKQRQELEDGVPADGNVYYNAVKAVPSHTYVLRSIAYNGKQVIVTDLGDKKLKTDLLAGDKRGDETVLFRYLGKDRSGNAKIVWRILRSIESPRLDMPEQNVNPPQVKRVVTVIN